MDYKGKVAVITGAANGIGRELAKQCAANGMKLSLGDIDAVNLAEVEKEMKATGTEVISSVLDVRKFDEFDAFAKKTIEHYGAVDLFFSNAGVAVVGTIWLMSEEDWKWGLETNVMGLVHGIKAFVPFMISQDRECRIINTASIGGLITSPNSPNYIASKHAAVALTEVLSRQLQDWGTKVKASVFCPGFIVTDLHNSERHRPPELKNDPNDPYYHSPDFAAKTQRMAEQVLGGIQLPDAINRLFKGLEAGKLHILTHPEYKPLVAARFQAILDAMPE
jgi:NADP-dependent 3-hydroxy acid dehydrogenase YdfG